MNLSEIDCCNQNLCKKCQGKCCKETGCFFMPEDFEKMELSYLRQRIDYGYITIAVITSNLGVLLSTPVLYLKIRNKGASICDVSRKGECILLTPTGCKLSFEERPSGGKGLIPDRPICHSIFTQVDIIEAWEPFDKILRELWSFYSDLSVEETIEKAKRGG